MLVKKLAVPFINEKLLQQVEHCSIATAAISETGFDFIRTRIPTKTKMDIVTGLEMPTSPAVLQRIWRNYQGRITLNIYTRNVFHANVYIFDLPYRKSVAFVGSGQFTIEGIKDSEELFYKITDAKEVENLKSWFIGYYEFAQPLSESLIDEYAWRYPVMKQREYVSRKERIEFLALNTSGFSWDSVRFRQQYFKKDDYLVFTSSKALMTTPELLTEREALQGKLLALHDQWKDHLKKLKLHGADDSQAVVSSINPLHHADGQLRSMWLSYGRDSSSLKKYGVPTTLEDVMHLQVVINQRDVGVYLIVGNAGKAKGDREYFRDRMIDVDYRKQFFTMLTALSPGYWIDVACERKNIDAFATEDVLWDFIKGDQWMYYNFIIGKNFSPEAVEISSENIAPTMMKEFDKLSLIYRQMKASEGAPINE